VHRRNLFVVLLVVAATAAWLAFPYARAAAFVLDLSGSRSWVRRVLPARNYAVTTRDVEVPTRYGAVLSRVYRAGTSTGRSVLVVPGIHGGGIDEPRLAAFSQRLASIGLTVLSLPVPDLRRYRITPTSTDIIEDAAAWMAANGELAPAGRIVIAGISYAGGLSVVAAGRPRLDGKIESVVSFGGHADLPRVMMFVCTGRLSDGTPRAPHDYAVSVLLLAAIPKLVPADQVQPAIAALTTFLDASSAQSADPARAAALATQARDMALTLPEPSRTLLRLANDRDVAALGPQMIPYIEELGGAPALSPDRSPATRAPVFAIHGELDNVIPSTETPLLAEYLRQQGNMNVRWLLTPLLSHADIQEPGLGDAWRMVRFWKEMLE
jgi:pimeloyl-ACP methyl ester carboxylesterase